MVSKVRSAVTEEELNRLDEAGRWVEVVDGELVEIDTDAMGYTHTAVISNVYDLLKPFVKANDLGYVHGDGLKYILAVSEDGIETSRTPDLVYLRKGRIPKASERDRPFKGAPDLAVEVASPGQSAPVLLKKVTDYLDHGTEEVWLLYPARKELHQYRRDEQAVRVYHEHAEVETPLFPGFKLSVSALFVIDEDEEA